MIPPLSAPAFRPQRGVALVVALILLLIMSLLAVTALRGTLMQERMSSNAYDRDLAFQSAEAGLRMGERQAENWANSGANPADLAGCNSPNTEGFYRNIDGDPGQCTTPLWEGEAPGEDGSFWHNASSDTEAPFADDGLSLAPYYIVELISLNAPCTIDKPDGTDTTCKRFRITASSRTDNGRAQVILQSIYAN